MIEFELLEERALYAFDHVHLEIPLLFDLVVELADAILDIFLFDVADCVVYVQLRVPEELAIYIRAALDLIVLISFGHFLRPRYEQCRLA